MAPVVSIIMPAFNRRHVIGRAIESVKQQSFQDWELIVVDDGSTDGTVEAIDTTDSRLRVLRQANAGASAARNAGIAASRGRYIAFLDSDDEWLPHFLALTCAFLEHHPEEAFVATEFMERSSDGSRIQDRSIIRDNYVGLARRLGSQALQLPPGTTDDYLRIYEQCTAPGDWWNQIAPQLPQQCEAARVYSGRIGEAYRWGHLHALWCLLIRREVVLALGPIAENRRSCADLKFLVDLCRLHRANMISVPSVVKHELSVADRRQAAGHLSAGKGYALFNKNQTALFEELFLSRDPYSRELSLLYGLHCLRTASAVLDNGERAECLHYLRLAARHLGNSPSLRAISLIARFVPTSRLAALAARKVLLLRARREARQDLTAHDLPGTTAAADGGTSHS